MKFSASMTSDQPRSFEEKSFFSSDRRLVIRSCLPIAATILLVIFLGGFPPTTLVLLFQTFGQLHSLLAHEGPKALVPLVILIVQSLFLVAAWVLLGWVTLREGAYLVTMQSKAELDRLLAFQSTTSELANLPLMGTKQVHLEQDFNEATNALFEEKQDEGVITVSIREEKPEEDAWVSQSMQPRAILPSNAQSRHAQPRALQPSNARSRDTQSRHAQLRTVQPSNLQSREVQARGAQLRSRVELEERLPRNPKSRNLQSRQLSNSRRGLATGLVEENSLENPFEKDLPSPPQGDDNVKQKRARMVTKREEPLEAENKEEKEDDKDNPFVYGNPFDGPLPDVFRYDAELRRSVLEMTGDDSPQNNSMQAKGSVAQKTRRS